MEQLQKQLQEEKEVTQKLEEKIEMMLMQAPHPPNAMQIRKLMVSPEDWDDEILGDPNDHGGDQIMLSGDKANGDWGLRVFLNLGPDPTDEAQSITSRVACWAGGIDALDRGETSVIPIRSLSELSTAVTKAACTQAMHKHGEPNDTLIPATVEYTMLKPLSRGALAILKPYLIVKQDETKRDREQNEEFDSDDPHRQLPTRAELMHEIGRLQCVYSAQPPCSLIQRLLNIPQYLISAASQNGISEVIADLEKRHIISGTHFPYNSPVRPL
ncbi:hypothetical protein QYF61_016211 [Mycteria americana]|uniref:Uncharacterized protein n=1 Tax=Mycteria americana TaxID=33587 RepID=A0AAN7N833_MYCAM|nr:hypothetical protein QYF61_016211 [Mycteria americana]